MDIGLFQLLPRSAERSASEVIAQAFSEIDFAEAHGFDSVWLAEHHFSGFGLVSAPSVFAAAIAARTTRIRIGYAVAVVPLHQPLRLAEEIAWLTHLSGGRVAVGVGPGFLEREFAGFGVPLDERHARLEEGLRIIRHALSGEEFSIEPAPLAMPPIYRAVSSIDGARRAAREGTPILVGTKPLPELAELLTAFRAEGGNVADAYVLREVCGSPREQLDALEELGVRRVIASFNGDVRRSMEMTAPLIRRSEGRVSGVTYS